MHFEFARENVLEKKKQSKDCNKKKIVYVYVHIT